MTPGAKPLAHVTHERIAELFDQGMKYTQIARRMGVSVDLIFSRMRKARKADPEVARRDLERRTCKCGHPKRPSLPACFWCRTGKPRPDAVQQALQLAEEKPEATARLQCEKNVRCPCGRRVMSANAHACALCQGTGEELDQLMAAERGISVEELRDLLKDKNKRGPKVVAA